MADTTESRIRALLITYFPMFIATLSLVTSIYNGYLNSKFVDLVKSNVGRVEYMKSCREIIEAYFQVKVRLVALNAAGNLVLGSSAHPVPNFERVLPKNVRAAPVGSIYEWRSDNVAFEIGRRVRDNGAALVIDYGHSHSDVGDTLQAIGQHAFADALAAPGSVDITAHVDFEAFGSAAESMGAAVHGPIDQRDFLLRLGIQARADALKAAASPEKKAEIDAAIERLTQAGRTGMGRLFKAIGLANPKLGPLPAFESE